MRLSGRATLLIVSPMLLLLAAAYLQWGIAGLPVLPAFAAPAAAAPSGFPGWLRVTHYVNQTIIDSTGPARRPLPYARPTGVGA